MAAYVYGMLERTGSGYHLYGFEASILPATDSSNINRYNQARPAADPLPGTLWMYDRAYYTPPASLPWGPGGGAPASPTQGQGWPR